MNNLDNFLATYGDRVIADINLEAFAAEHIGEAPMFIVRFGDKVAVIHPMLVADYIDIDVHPFVDGKDASAAVIGFIPTNRLDSFDPKATPSRSNGLPAANLVAVIIGNQSTEEK